MTIEARAQDLIDSFNKFSEWEARYREIIQIGKKASDIDESEKVDKHIVKGCQSQVWLVPALVDGKVILKADSDAFIVKGLVNLLTQVYSGSTPKEILEYKQDFLKEIGIVEHLSMNRSNGIRSVYKQIHLYAIAYNGLVEKGIMSL